MTDETYSSRENFPAPRTRDAYVIQELVRKMRAQGNQDDPPWDVARCAEILGVTELELVHYAGGQVRPPVHVLAIGKNFYRVHRPAWFIFYWPRIWRRALAVLLLTGLLGLSLRALARF